MLVYAFVVVAWACVAAVQQSVEYASIGGRVIDPSGAVVAGARVTARQTDTNLVARATTDANGRFRFSYLKVGPYEVTVEEPGFADVKQTLSLAAGAAFDLPISLTLV